MNCVVLRVRSRAEKKIKYLCEEYKIPCYLPVYFKSKKYQRRTVTREFPLFPGYVFVSLSDEKKQKRLFASGLIVATIKVTNQRALIHQLRVIKRILNNDPEVLATSTYKIGQSVEIVEGALKGTQGIIEEINSKKSKIFLNIEIIGQSVVIEVDNDCIEPID